MSPTALMYLRVSSVGQVNKGYSPEGYSIPGQREACVRYAEGLGAEIVREYVEPGKSGTTTNRPALQRMLVEMDELKPDYAILYDLSRVARDDFDALWLLREIEGRGCKLESALERVDSTPAGRLLYTVMAGVNAFRSRGDAEKVKMGMKRKHAMGGTNGRAPIGYLNVRKRISGREVRTVEIDPDRAPLIQMAFRWYATGEYAISTVTEMLAATGLQNLRTGKRQPAPLGRSMVHDILRDDYYIGVVTYDGVKNPNGEHPAIIDNETFERVQELLTAHKLSGDRSRKYEHYLKGSIYCGECGGRLVYSPVRGNGGRYEYFKCYSKYNRRSDCDAGHLSVDEVEAKVERFYRNYPWLTETEKDRVRAAVRRSGGIKLRAAKKEAERATRRLDALKQEQQRLLHLSYKGLVDDEVLAAEQARIKQERALAAKWIQTADHNAEDIARALEEALELLEDPGTAYHLAAAATRRLFNQALFERLLIKAGDGVSATLAPWFQALEDVGRPSRTVNRSAQLATGGSLKAALDRHEAENTEAAMSAAKV